MEVKKIKKKSIMRYVLLGVFLVGLCFPYSTVEIPEMKIKAVNSDFQPVANFKLIQTTTLNRYSDEIIETKISDENGDVIFSEKSLFLPLLIRIILNFEANINNFIMPHGSETSAKAKIWSNEGSSYSWIYYYKSQKVAEYYVVR
jgi:hypothetical protein